MATVISLEEIKSLLENIDLVAAMEKGFIHYSNGHAVVPPVAELLFEDPPGDVHIKYGYIKEKDFYCIKIASGFYQNVELGISNSQGMMLLFNQKTGQTEAVLLDEGYLTDARTAAAGALAAKYFAPKNLSAIGIIGTGGQAKLQLEYLQEHSPCKEVWVWGRRESAMQDYVEAMGPSYTVHLAKDPAEVAAHCNLIVTTTPSTEPLLSADEIRPGTHITAVGSDTSEKQELDGRILDRADLVIADSIPQSRSRGEIYQATKTGYISADEVVELGVAIQDPALQRRGEDQISVVDLTGVAVQDIMIATAVFRAQSPEPRT